MNLPKQLYSAAEVRELDRITIREQGVPGYELMSRAGQCAFATLLEFYPQIQTVAVFCGAGNNAGDAYILARLSLLAGLETQLYALTEPKKLTGDALKAAQAYLNDAGGKIMDYASFTDSIADVIVDGLLGTGLDRKVTGLYAGAIADINASNKPVLALDIPSGLHADSGSILGCAICATITVTFIGLKRGLFTGFAAEQCGKIIYASLAVPDSVYQHVQASAWLLQQAVLKPRARCAHKGNHGHVLVIGGEYGYCGAARMAAEAAARVGAGLVSVATRSNHASLINSGRPELMCHGVEDEQQLQPLLEKATVLVLGPGLGQSAWAEKLFQQALLCQKAIVMDADALNLLAKYPQTHRQWVLTPHPGEAARLLQTTTDVIGQDRFAASTALQKKYQGVVVLKGAGSLVADDQNIFVSPTGNPGMASGGFGDVLAGMIGGLIAQSLHIAEATRMAVYWHGEAADIAASAEGERGLLASDLMPYIRQLVNRT